MARVRLLHPEFLRHEGLGELVPIARLLFAGLWTIADREGRLEDRPLRIRAELLPYDDADVDMLLQTLESVGVIIRYEVDSKRYIAIPSWRKWQHPHPKEKRSEIPEPGKDAVSRVKERTSPVKDMPSRAVSSVPSASSDTDSTTLAQFAATQPPAPEPETPFVAFVRSKWADVKDPADFERRAREAFPAVDPLVEARKAFGWEHSDPKRRKRSHGKFLWGWFGRAQDNANRPGAPGKANPVTATPAAHEAFGAGGEIKL